MRFQDAFGIGQEPGSVSGKPNAAAASMQQALAECFLQPLDLHGHGGLRPPNPRRGRAERSRLCGMDECHEQAMIKWGAHINSAYIGIEYYQFYWSCAIR